MKKNEIIFVLENVLLITSGYILLEILFGKRKVDDPVSKANEINKQALIDSYNKMKEQYPEIVNG